MGASNAVVVLAAYGLWAWFVGAAGVVQLSQGVNLSLYFVGTLGAVLWNYQIMQSVGGNVNRLSWPDCFRLGLQQAFRLALVLVSLAFVTKDIEVSRTFLLGFIVVGGVLFVALNRVLPQIVRRMVFGAESIPAVVVGWAEDADLVVRWFARQPELGMRVIGFLSDEEPGPADELAPVPRLGGLHELRRMIAETGALHAVVAQLRYTPEECRRLSDEAEASGCRVRFFLNLRSYFGNHPLAIEAQGGYAFVNLTSEPLENPVNRLLKRALDIAVSLPVVLFVLPVLAAVVAIAQRKQSPGPLFHRQQRSGLNRQRFLIYKFRTMHPQTAGGAGLVKQATKGDSRIYPFGAFMRRTSLDEIPQFINVLLGDMSVSGPRPHLLEHDEQFARLVGKYHLRHFVKPGITGLAQSLGFRGEISDPALLHKRIGYDMLYITQWSLLLDLRIIFQTARQIIFPPKTAY